MTTADLQRVADRAVMIAEGNLLDPRARSLTSMSPYATGPGSAYYIFLYLLAQEIGPAEILELGTLCGVGTCHFALGSPVSHVTTVDLHPKIEHAPPNVTVVTGNALDVHGQFAEASIDVLFIDTDHAPEHMLAEYAVYEPKVKPGGIILFDDIEMGTMSQAWAQIPEPKFTLPLHAHLGFGAQIKEK